MPARSDRGRWVFAQGEIAFDVWVTPEVQKMVANPKKVNEMAQNLKQMRMAVPLVGCDWRVP